MTIRQLNLEKKAFRCLKCGRTFITDRCHRICARCKKAMFRYREGIRPVLVYATDMEVTGGARFDFDRLDIEVKF
jgi:Zn finger protein HypA/HybF involved in hydrogenase expression